MCIIFATTRYKYLCVAIEEESHKEKDDELTRKVNEKANKLQEELDELDYETQK